MRAPTDRDKLQHGCGFNSVPKSRAHNGAELIARVSELEAVNRRL